MDLIRRDAWGAKPPTGKPLTIPAPVRDLFLHHSAGPDNGLQSVQSIQRFHQDTRGWADIAYTWLYSPRDRAWFEGRGPGISGAHTRNHNRTSHAVCVLGNWEVSAPPPHVAEDLSEWARWHGTTWGPDYYRGHRDVGATACPGRYLYALLDDINARARADIRPQLDDTPEPAAEWRRSTRTPLYDGWMARMERDGLLDD